MPPEKAARHGSVDSSYDKDFGAIWPYMIKTPSAAIWLHHGNKSLCSRGEGGKRPQLVEVTPEKSGVWVINKWKNLGPATTVQRLTEPGLSERLGDLER